MEKPDITTVIEYKILDELAELAVFKNESPDPDRGKFLFGKPGK